MSSLQRVFINISDVASLIGQNKWDSVTPFERLWKKADKQSIQALSDRIRGQVLAQTAKVAELQSQAEDLEVMLTNKVITARQFDMRKGKIEKQIESELHSSRQMQDSIDAISIDAKAKLAKEFGEDVIKALQDVTLSNESKLQKINECIDNASMTVTGFKLDNTKKKEYKDEVLSTVNKTHGISNEASAISQFETQFNCKLDTRQEFLKKLVVSSSTREWYICGRLDGINHLESYIVEVKNRTRSFFYTVRDYENTQIQLYMLMMGYESAKLVECKNGTKIKVTDIKYQTSYIDDIMSKLERFIDLFEIFLQSPDHIKMDYLLLTKDDKTEFLHRKFFSKLRACPNYKSSSECLLTDSSTESDDNLA